jgi:hypothetical protein
VHESGEGSWTRHSCDHPERTVWAEPGVRRAALTTSNTTVGVRGLEDRPPIELDDSVVVAAGELQRAGGLPVFRVRLPGCSTAQLPMGVPVVTPAVTSSSVFGPLSSNVTSVVSFPSSTSNWMWSSSATRHHAFLGARGSTTGSDQGHHCRFWWIKPPSSLSDPGDGCR